MTYSFTFFDGGSSKTSDAGRFWTGEASRGERRSRVVSGAGGK